MMIKILFFLLILPLAVVSFAGELREKALAGDALAQFQLGHYYFFERKNPTLAVYWLRKAAAQKIPLAMYQLAVCMERGWGTGLDAAGALAYYEMLEAQGMSAAGYRLGMLLWEGVFEQVEPERERALELLRKYAPVYAPARLALIRIYWQNEEMRKAFAGELRRLAEAALKEAPHDPDIQLAVARLCRDGVGAVGDPRRAVELTGNAAAGGNLEAKLELASYYEAGYGCKADPQKAFELVREAALGGLPEAEKRYGEYLLAGDYCTHDPVLGAEYIRNAQIKIERQKK